MKKHWLTTGRFDLIFFSTLYIGCLLLSFNFQFPAGKPKSDINLIQSDQAQYYVYLPATFIYRFDIYNFPENIDKKCKGFLLDFHSGKLIIKMTYGVALLCSPFFLLTHLIAILFHLNPDGFSLVYQQMIILCACFYLVMGLYFLMRFLKHYFSRAIPYFVVILIFAGTNLFYFSLKCGLMSHVYSFFLFAVYLFLLKRFLDKEKKNIKDFILISFVISLAILIRPTSVFILTFMVFLDSKSMGEIVKRLKFFIHPKYSLALIIICFIIFIPQFFYWKYLSGNWIYYSYHGEGFSNWNHPMIIESWFAPLNGLFLYNPLVLFFITGIFIMIFKKQSNGIFIGLFFLFISYICSSWWCWYYGGSYGARAYIEYFTLLSVPFGYFLEFVKIKRNLFFRSLMVFLLISASYYNIRIFWNNGLYYGSIWSWDNWLNLLDISGIYHHSKTTYTFIDDYENVNIKRQEFPSNYCVHSPTEAINSSGYEFCNYYSWRLSGILDHPVKRVTAEIWINPLNLTSTGTNFVCSIEDTSRKIFYYRYLKIDNFLTKPNEWFRVSGTFNIPEWIDQRYFIVFYVWNIHHNKFYLDDLKIRFE